MRVNPFDIKTVLLARHAQHVVLIHFPIALFIVAVAFDYVAQRTRIGRWPRRRISICCWRRFRRCLWLQRDSRHGSGRSRDKS